MAQIVQVQFITPVILVITFLLVDLKLFKFETQEWDYVKQMSFHICLLGFDPCFNQYKSIKILSKNYMLQIQLNVHQIFVIYFLLCFYYVTKCLNFI
jgi:hypothetical protein